MRLLFAATGAPGHLFPLLPLADAARRAGHDVEFATSESMLPVVAKAGLEPIQAGLEPAEAYALATTHRPDSLPPEEVGKVFAMVFGDILPRAAFADIQPYIVKTEPDLVIFEKGIPGAGLAAEHEGVPALCHTYGRVVTNPMTEAIAGLVDAVAADLGVTRLSRPFVDICPDSLQDKGFLADNERLPIRPAGWSDPGAEVPAIVRDRDRSRPLVYLTLSTVELLDPALLNMAIDGLAKLPVDVLVSAGATAADQLTDLPGNVHVAAWTPQPLVIPHVDLVVHHGGAGAMYNAFGAGVPQLVLQNPQADVNAIASTVTGAGAGAALVQFEVTADSVHQHAERLLEDESVKAAARVLAAEIAAMPSPDEVAERLADHVVQS